MRSIFRKIISVVSGYFVSLPFFYVNINPVVDSLILCIFFIFYYWLVDKIIDLVERKLNDENE
ncbi:MAG: hypothetical protein ACXQS8_06630 [Candidatus Helarchaeales archaeon]